MTAHNQAAKAISISTRFISKVKNEFKTMTVSVSTGSDNQLQNTANELFKTLIKRTKKSRPFTGLDDFHKCVVHRFITFMYYKIVSQQMNYYLRHYK